MPVRTTRFIAAIVLFSQLVFAACVPALALCQEVDGAVSIEWAAAVCCTPSSTPAPPGAGLRLVEQDDCAGCDDTLLDIQRVEDTRTDCSPPPAPSRSWISAPPPVRLVVPAQARCRAGPPPPHLRTTVLRH